MNMDVPKLVETSYEGTESTAANGQNNNKPDIIIRDKKKRNTYVHRCCN
jgi:hypothetical protein